MISLLSTPRLVAIRAFLERHHAFVGIQNAIGFEVWRREVREWVTAEAREVWQ